MSLVVWACGYCISFVDEFCFCRLGLIASFWFRLFVGGWGLVVCCFVAYGFACYVYLCLCLGLVFCVVSGFGG